MGWLLVAIATVNGLLAVIFSVVVLRVGLDIIIGMIPSQAEAAGSIGRAAIQALFARYIELELIISAALLVVGVLLIVGAIFIGKKADAVTIREPKATQDSVPNEAGDETATPLTPAESAKA